MLQLIPIFAILLVTPRLSFWDLTSHRLPNRITLPLIAISFLGAFLTFDLVKILTAAGLGLVTFLLGWALSSLSAIGMGDVKLLVGIALALGTYSWATYLLALMLGFLVATIVSVIQLLRGKIYPSSSIALGPYLLFGFAVVAVQPIAEILFTAAA